MADGSEWVTVAVFPQAMAELEVTRCPRTCMGTIYRYVAPFANRIIHIQCDRCGLRG
jgi:hypothetical protein